MFVQIILASLLFFLLLQQYFSSRMKRSQTKNKTKHLQPIQKASISIMNSQQEPVIKHSIHAHLPSINNIKKQQMHYKIKEKIGQGAFAQVKKGKREPDNLPVAIKIYSKMKLYDKDRRKSVQQEISILETLNHNGIIKLLDTYETDTQIHLVMECFSTLSLRTFIKEKGKLSQQQIRNILSQLADTLSYLHSNNIAHRDIKLENILINKNTLKIKLIDFGFAIKASGHSVRSTLIGTPCYLPPQMISAKQYDPFKADIWSMGILFYFLCTGYFPYRSIDNKLLQSKIVKGQLLFPSDMNPGCQYLITKMLKHNQEQRICVKDLLEDTWMKPVNFSEKIALLKKQSITSPA